MIIIIITIVTVCILLEGISSFWPGILVVNVSISFMIGYCSQTLLNHIPGSCSSPIHYVKFYAEQAEYVQIHSHKLNKVNNRVLALKNEYPVHCVKTT